jgi:hypothetical protein
VLAAAEEGAPAAERLVVCVRRHDENVQRELQGAGLSCRDKWDLPPTRRCVGRARPR